MRLTQHFSRVKADLPPPESEDGFLHEEGSNLPFQGGRRNLPFQEEESTLEDRPYSREEINKLFHENNMPDPVTYQGDEYDFTGKAGMSFKKPRTLSFEYSNHGNIDGEEVEEKNLDEHQRRGYTRLTEVSLMLLSHDCTYIRSSRIAQLNDEMIQKILDRHGSKLSTVDFRWIYNNLLDVTTKADLLAEWVVKSIAKGKGRIEDIRRFENLARFYFSAYKTPKFKKAVEEHARLEGKQINPKNILDFDLFDLDDVYDIYEAPEVNPRINQLQSKLPEGSQIFYNDGNYQIVKANTPEAACDLARGTKWCTSDISIASSYLEESPLYIFYREGKKFAQLHVNKDVQFMDLRDRPILINEQMIELFANADLLTDDMIKKLPGVQLFGELELYKSPVVAQAMAKNHRTALWYAAYVMRGSFLLGEEVIATDPRSSAKYANIRNRGRFFEGEDAIARSEDATSNYYIYLRYDRGMGEEKDFMKEYPHTVRWIKEFEERNKN